MTGKGFFLVALAACLALAAWGACAPAARLVWAKSPPVSVSVTGFGAKGDGATDDRAAIQAAIAAGDDVYLPAGRYVVSGWISLRSGVRLRGDPGRTILLASADMTGAPSGTGNQGQLFDGSGVTGVTLTGLTLDGRERKAGLAAFTAGADVAVRDCVSRNHPGAQAVMVSETDGFEVSGNVFERVFHGFQGWRCRNGRVERNRVDVCVGGLWGAGMRNVLVGDNVVANCADVGVDFEGGRNLRASGNVVSSCGNAEIVLFKENADVKAGLGCHDIEYSGNTVRRTPTYRRADGDQAACSLAGGGLMVADNGRETDRGDNSGIVFRNNVVDVEYGFGLYHAEQLARSDVTWQGNTITLRAGPAGWFRLLSGWGQTFLDNQFVALIPQPVASEFKNLAGGLFQGNRFHLRAGQTQDAPPLLYYTDARAAMPAPCRFEGNQCLADGGDGPWIRHDPYRTNIPLTLAGNDFPASFFLPVLNTPNGACRYAGQVIKRKLRLGINDLAAQDPNLAGSGVIEIQAGGLPLRRETVRFDRSTPRLAPGVAKRQAGVTIETGPGMIILSQDVDEKADLAGSLLTLEARR